MPVLRQRRHARAEVDAAKAKPSGSGGGTAQELIGAASLARIDGCQDHHIVLRCRADLMDLRATTTTTINNNKVARWVSGCFDVVIVVGGGQCLWRGVAHLREEAAKLTHEAQRALEAC